MSLFYRIKKFFKRKNLFPVYIKIPESKILEGKTALIIGGCGGIGFAIAKSFREAGCDVVITGTNEERLCSIADKLNAKYVLLDIKNFSSISNAIQEAFKKCNDCIDILVNASGVNCRKDFFSFTEDDYNSVMDINVKGTFFITQIFAKEMYNRGIKGHILNVASSSSLRPAWSPYRISKVLVSQITKGFADVLLPYGIIVNAIGPGPTATSMMGLHEDDPITLDSNPSGRYATPAEIAYLATYLVSDMANLVVGETVYITGGSGVISYHK